MQRDARARICELIERPRAGDRDKMPQGALRICDNFIRFQFVLRFFTVYTHLHVLLTFVSSL